VLRGGAAAAERLAVLAEAAWPTTRRLLHNAGVRRGWHFLDAGCGNGHVAIQLAAMAGADGSATGIDMDEGVLHEARRLARGRKRAPHFRAGSVLELEATAAYDLVYARFLLTHLADPGLGLSRLIGAAKPGGLVAVEDIDFRSHFSYPRNAAFDRYGDLYRMASQHRGADPLIGPKLVGMFIDAGLQDVRFEIVEPMFNEGDGKRIPQLTMEHIRESVVGAGLADHAEVDAVIADLDAFRLDPRTIMGFPRVFQVWGRRPMTAETAHPPALDQAIGHESSRGGRDPLS
jgi:ubiquinone/menaquinone biosynthesis C-methylase UbiE